MNISPRSIIRDASGVFALLEIIGTPKSEAAKELLIQIHEEAQKAVAAEAKAAEQLRAVEQRTAVLDGEEAEIARVRRELEQGEARLKDAEQQHQFVMDGEMKGLNAQKEAFAEQVKEAAAARKRFITDHDAISADLGKREKALVKRELDAQKRDEALTAREQVWKQGMHDLETTKAELKRIMA